MSGKLLLSQCGFAMDCTLCARWRVRKRMNVAVKYMYYYDSLELMFCELMDQKKINLTKQ